MVTSKRGRAPRCALVLCCVWLCAWMGSCQIDVNHHEEKPTRFSSYSESLKGTKWSYLEPHQSRYQYVVFEFTSSKEVEKYLLTGLDTKKQDRVVFSYSYSSTGHSGTVFRSEGAGERKENPFTIDVQKRELVFLDNPAITYTLEE